ncbi:MAG: hypothetical protein P4L50_13700 [Anaerolineaceae bacterium]|nr:hypothetical protein [Anaerolineaceae bacterium]
MIDFRPLLAMPQMVILGASSMNASMTSTFFARSLLKFGLTVLISI